MIFKIDLEKAYEHVEWDFVDSAKIEIWRNLAQMDLRVHLHDFFFLFWLIALHPSCSKHPEVFSRDTPSLLSAGGPPLSSFVYNRGRGLELISAQRERELGMIGGF